jgi:hypothetical protein
MEKYKFEHCKSTDGLGYLCLFGTDPKDPYQLCGIYTDEYDSKKEAESAIVEKWEKMLKFYEWYEVVSKLTNEEKMNHPDFSHLNRTGHTIFFKKDLHLYLKTYAVGNLKNSDVYKYTSGKYKNCAMYAEISRCKLTTAYDGKEIIGNKRDEIIKKVNDGVYVIYNFYVIDPNEPNKMICHHEAS